MKSAHTDRPLHGKAVIVTGGGTGIGRATARRFADEGAGVLVVGRTGERLRETAKGRPGIRVLVADVTDPAAPERVVEAAVKEFGRLDVLVNNAAILRPAALDELDQDVAQEEVAVNLLAPMFLTREALSRLTDTRGVVVNVTSNPPHRGWAGCGVYGATKVALDFLTRTWAVEVAGRGVRVVSVAPGITDTPVMLHAGFTPDRVEAGRAAILRRVPLGRIARPAEIAWWIVAATLPEAAYLTGSVLRVDGGMAVA